MPFFFGKLPVIHFVSVAFGASFPLDFMWFHKNKAVVKWFFGLKNMVNNLISILLLIENHSHIFG